MTKPTEEQLREALGEAANKLDDLVLDNFLLRKSWCAGTPEEHYRTYMSQIRDIARFRQLLNPEPDNLPDTFRKNEGRVLK